MISIVGMIALIAAGIVLSLIKLPDNVLRDESYGSKHGQPLKDESGNIVSTEHQLTRPKGFVSAALIMLGMFTGIQGSINYNDSGYCQHIQTIFGTESSTCSTGWYFEGWGQSTEWPHFITVSNTNSVEAEGSSINRPYPVRLADNWNGDVTQTTRFGIPLDRDQFLKMHRDFRSPERLITTTLRPAVTSSLDSIANLFSMEEYYAGGKRDAFKTEFRDAVIKGRAKVRQVSRYSSKGAFTNKAASSDLSAAQDTSQVGETNVRQIVMEKVKDNAGNEIREEHGYITYGVTVSSAILENLDPDDRFEKQIQARKDAASRRIVAQEERREQEEQRLLEIQRGETDIAKRQAAAKTEQIQQTTEAETTKKLALIRAERVKEEAQIAKDTAAIKLERARIDAEAKQVTADAEAYQKQVILEADGALQQKLDAWVKAQTVWADAASRINVPTTVFAGSDGKTGNALNTVSSFMDIMTAQAAKQLQVNPTITK